MLNGYHSLLAEVIEHGVPQKNRTGIDTLMIPGAMLKFDLGQGFPAITTKKLAFKAMKGELLGFFRGYSNAANFRELGCNIWDANANETPAWLSSSFRKGTDDLGRIYGCQWTDWGKYEEASSVTGEPVYRRESVNQLENALSDIKFNPQSRRILISGWRPDEFDRMSLPPCHVSYHFLVDQTQGKLHLSMFQRSADMFLGVPFNIASSALFLEIMARLAGLQAGTFTHFLSDVHVYTNHLEQAREQLERTAYPAPTLFLSETIRPVQSLTDIPGIFSRIDPVDIELIGYQSHPALKAPMAV